MVVTPPQYLLFCSAHLIEDSSLETAVRGCWHFSLQRMDRPGCFQAGDEEPIDSVERLALLAVVRGLEAIDEPGSVTLITSSRYVLRGLRYGLPSWRRSDFMWERFGELIPVRNADLWRRVDRALEFHAVYCRPWPAEMKRSGLATNTRHPAVPAHFSSASRRTVGIQPRRDSAVGTAVEASNRRLRRDSLRRKMKRATSATIEKFATANVAFTGAVATVPS